MKHVLKWPLPKRAAILVSASMAALAMLAGAPAAGQGRGAETLIRAQAGARAPAIAFADRQGRMHQLSEFRGKVVIVNLWASWCAPCRTEMPALDRLARAYPADLAVVAISQDSGGWPAIDGFWAGQRPAIRTYLSTNDGLAKHYGAIGLPYSILLDRNGREIGRIPRAAEWDRGQLLGAVRAAIAKKPKQ